MEGDTADTAGTADAALFTAEQRLATAQLYSSSTNANDGSTFETLTYMLSVKKHFYDWLSPDPKNVREDT